jgi:alpha-D-ribose 1-methylphosphonate 5-triphosphate diphosphatase PhnM
MAPPGEIFKRIARNGGLGLVGFVGVQSNEFPRTLDLARRFRAAGVQVMIGGFHDEVLQNAANGELQAASLVP